MSNLIERLEKCAVQQLGRNLLAASADHKFNRTIKTRRAIVASNLREIGRRQADAELRTLALQNMQELAVEVQKARKAHREKVA